MNITVLVAKTTNNVIGYKGKMPWNKLSIDLKRFRLITEGGIVVMGRKTFDSIGRPLKNRYNVVVTRDTEFDGSQVDAVINDLSIEELRRVSEELQCKDVYIIGGGEIYCWALQHAHKVEVTQIYHSSGIEGDTYFPKLGKEWGMAKRTGLIRDNGHTYCFITYKR